MKILGLILLLIVWIMATLILALSIIGLVVLMDEDSTWMEFPIKILDTLREYILK